MNYSMGFLTDNTSIKAPNNINIPPHHLFKDSPSFADAKNPYNNNTNPTTKKKTPITNRRSNNFFIHPY